MKRYVQVAAGVTIIVVPPASTIGFVIYEVLLLQAELARYRHMFVTIPFGLTEIATLILLIALTIAACIWGVKLIDLSRHADGENSTSSTGRLITR